MRVWLACLMLLLVRGIGHGAEFKVINIPDTPITFVSLKGEIEEGDADKFSEAIRGHDRVTVMLESPGGLVKEALEIGATIRVNHYTTMVTAEASCFSACGLIWLSGERRYMADTSLLGFHAAYREENGEYKESGVANAEIGSFLTHLGLRIEAIRFFTVAGPTEFLLLSPSRARALGIEVYLLDGANVTTPSSRPTVDVFAARFVSFGVMEANCAALLQPDRQALRLASKDSFDAGNALVSSEEWIKLWTQLLDAEKQKLEAEGTLLNCIETEARLRAQRLPTGISGPSFNCRSETTPTERTLCEEESLWAKDRALSAIYMWIRANTDKPVRRRLLEVQRSWLKMRNSCGADEECLTAVYDQRLQELKDIEFD